MIKINDKYYIKPDDRQFVLLKAFQDKDGKPLYSAIGYYTSMTLAVKQILQIEFADEVEKDTYTLKQAVKKYEEISKRYEKYLV